MDDAHAIPINRLVIGKSVGYQSAVTYYNIRPVEFDLF
jgi:hypothetical protein